jgi:acyl transferase domain-containing protein
LIQEYSNGLFKDGMPSFWSNLGQGDEHEASFMHSRVWDLEDRRAKDLFSIQEDV